MNKFSIGEYIIAHEEVDAYALTNTKVVCQVTDIANDKSVYVIPLRFTCSRGEYEEYSQGMRKTGVIRLEYETVVEAIERAMSFVVDSKHFSTAKEKLHDLMEVC